MASPNFSSRSVVAAVRKAVPAGIAAFGLLALAAPMALAQSTSIDPARAPRVNAGEGFGSSDASNGVFGDSASPFDLIHRAVLMNDRSPSDFSREHRGRITDAANNFRIQQQNELRREAQPVAPEVTPETGAE